MMENLKKLDDIADIFKKQQKSSWVENFDSLSNDKDRITTLINVFKAENYVQFDDGLCKKSSEKAEKFRNDGNLAFSNKKYEEAFKLYEKAVEIAPCFELHNSEELSKAFANRSASLFYLEQYQQCLNDIDAAIHHGYSKALIYKLYERQGKCYKNLKKFAKSIESYGKAVLNIQCSSLDKCKLDEIISRYENEISIAQEKKSVDSNETDSSQDTGQGNSLSSKCSVKYLKCTGRSVVANKNIPVGEIICQENPVTSIIYENYRKKYCDFCFRKFDISFPCPSCCDVSYCSLKCCESASKSFHRFECTILKYPKFNLLGCRGHLVLRHTIMNFKHDKELKHDIGARSISMIPTNIYSFDISEFIYHENAYDAKEQLTLCVLTLLILFLLKKSNWCEEMNQQESNLASEMFDTVLCVYILKHLKIFICNDYVIHEIVRSENFQFCKVQDIGHGIYTIPSMFNHSCDPNVDVTYSNKMAIFRTIKYINKGDQLFADYDPIFTTHSLSERRFYLKTNYFFDCKCQACKFNWSQTLEAESATKSLLCECGSKIVINSAKENIECSDCYNKMESYGILQMLNNSYNNYKTGMSMAFSWELDSALPLLIDHLTLLQKHLALPSKEYYSCQAVIKQILRLKGNLS